MRRRSKRHRLTAGFSMDEVVALEQAAEQERSSVSAIIGRAVRDYLRQRSEDAPNRVAIERVPA